MKKLTTKILNLMAPPPETISSEEQERNYWKWVHSDFTESEKEVIENVSPYSMTSKERLVNLIRAVEYLVKHKIEGEFVECGVWKGGSGMAIALTLNRLGDLSRKIHLYDTFDGMSEPSAQDVSIDGISAVAQMQSSSKHDPNSVWCYSSLNEVRDNMRSTRYPEQNISFIEGRVEETIPRYVPEKIALLRLDTDWYESTKHELEHLFPRLVQGGVLIIDDYGHWEGCRRAVDEYIRENNLTLFLTRIDYTGRMAIKP